MKHRISLFLLMLALLVSCIAPAALADSLDGLSIERALIRAEGDGYEYFTYEPTGFDAAGNMGGIQLDLDEDGAAEYLTVDLSDDGVVTMTVSESEDGVWTEAATAALYDVNLTCNIQANDVFLKRIGNAWYIFNENWTQENSVADGAAWSFTSFCYTGDSLQQNDAQFVDGTDVSGDLDEWLNNADLYEYRPELRSIAEELSFYDFDIDGLYWGNMIMEQDHSLIAVCRLYSKQDVAYQTVSDFTFAGGSNLSGFSSHIVDCASNGYLLDSIHYLSNNAAPYDAGEISESAETEIDVQWADTEDADESVESEYIIPDSDVRELTADELSIYDKDTLAIIRNEILARYGYPFQKQKYIDYFGSKSWYERNEGFTYDMLSSLEMENIELIKKLEAK